MYWSFDECRDDTFDLSRVEVYHIRISQVMHHDNTRVFDGRYMAPVSHHSLDMHLYRVLHLVDMAGMQSITTWTEQHSRTKSLKECSRKILITRLTIKSSRFPVSKRKKSIKAGCRTIQDTEVRASRWKWPAEILNKCK